MATFHLQAGAVTPALEAEEPAEREAVLDAYYGTALPLLTQATGGLEVLHASAVLVPSVDGVFAFCGTPGSGKSTIAYGLATRGHAHWADDTVAFRTAGSQQVHAVGLPFIAKLRENSSAYFDAALDASISDSHEDREVPLDGVFLLDPTESTELGSPSLTRLAPAEALRALLDNSFRFRPSDPERRDASMRSYLDLVASIPILRVRYPRGFDHLPDLLAALERAMRGRHGGPPR